MQREPLKRLLDQAFLYDDPGAYQAGVRAAWQELSRIDDPVRRPADTDVLPQAQERVAATG